MAKPINLPLHLLGEDTEVDESLMSGADESDTVEEELEDSDNDTEEEEAWDEESDEVDEGEDEEDDAEDEDEGDEADSEEAADEDEEDSDEEQSEDDSFLPPFDRKKLLDEHPELELPFKHMQAAFTRKTQELAQLRAETETMQEQLTDFVSKLNTDEGVQDHLERLMLHKPEVFAKVVEAWEESLADDDVREQRVREIQLKDREKAIKQRDELDARKAQTDRIEKVVSLAESTSEAEGLTDEDSVAIAKQFVLAKIHENKAKHGQAQISDEEVVAAVKAAAKHLKAKTEKTVKTEKVVQRKAATEKAKKKLKQSKRPSPAKKAGATVRKKSDVPSGMDPVHYAIQKGLGLMG